MCSSQSSCQVTKNSWFQPQKQPPVKIRWGLVLGPLCTGLPFILKYKTMTHRYICAFNQISRRQTTSLFMDYLFFVLHHSKSKHNIHEHLFNSQSNCIKKGKKRWQIRFPISQLRNEHGVQKRSPFYSYLSKSCTFWPKNRNSRFPLTLSTAKASNPF